MPGRNIGDLPWGPAPYRVDRRTDRDDGLLRFEAPSFAREQDRKRAKALEKARTRYPAMPTKRALRLERKLRLSGEGTHDAETLASHVTMSGHRIKVAGAIWQLFDQELLSTTCTIIPRTWELAPAELEAFNPVERLNAFRTDLYRNGAALARGRLCAFIHGEFDPIACVYRLHLHLACSAEMVPVLDRLRALPNYRSTRFLANGELSPVYRRIWVRRKPLYNLPDPITYLVQAFWPSRPIIITDDGKRVRRRQKQAIPEPFHSAVLLWLDRWELKDLTLLVGLRVTSAGLRPTLSKK